MSASTESRAESGDAPDAGEAQGEAIKPQRAVVLLRRIAIACIVTVPVGIALLVLARTIHWKWLGMLGYYSALLATICLVLVVIVGFIYSVLFRLQFRLLELMLTLILASIPVGLLVAEAERKRHGDVYGFAFILFGAAMVLLGAIAGLLWGAYTAKRRGEERTMQRLRLIALGWGAVAGLAIIPMLVMGRFGIEDIEPSGVEAIVSFAICWFGQALAIPAICIESRLWRRKAKKPVTQSGPQNQTAT